MASGDFDGRISRIRCSRVRRRGTLPAAAVDAALLVYALFAIAAVIALSCRTAFRSFAPLMGVVGIVGVIIAYVKRDDAAGDVGRVALHLADPHVLVVAAVGR